jgi:hypothetical protein
MKAKQQILIGLLSLAGLLAYTWTHTGGLLAGYVRPEFVGYLSAGGIELSIVGLSLRIGELRKSNVNPKFLGSTLIAVVVVSALANMSEGFAVKFGEPLTLANLGQLDTVQAIVSVAATGLISLVTLALSEIVGSDVSAAVKISSRQSKALTSTGPLPAAEVARKLSIPAKAGTELSLLEQARAVKSDLDTQAKAAAITRLLDYLQTHPDAGVTELAKVIGRSRSTLYSYLAELETAGKVHRNAHLALQNNQPEGVGDRQRTQRQPDRD